MKQYTLRNASLSSFSTAQIQQFFVDYPSNAIDPRQNDELANAMEQKNAFVITDSTNEIKGVFSVYANYDHTDGNKIYAELGSNILAPEIQGYGLLAFQLYIRIFGVVLQRFEKNEDLSRLIFHTDTLGSFPHTGPKLRRLGFTEIPRDDKQYYPHIKCDYERADSIYFILDPAHIRKQVSFFAKNFLSLLEKSAYERSDLEGQHVMLKHRVREDAIIVQLAPDILMDKAKFKVVTELAKD